jgi:hypothetical protein
MGLSDQLKGAFSQAKEKAEEFADKHSDQIDAAKARAGETAGKAKERASAFADKHSDQIGAAMDKVGETADKATKGKYADQIGAGRSKAKSMLDDFGQEAQEGQDGGAQPPTTQPSTTQPPTGQDQSETK